MAHNHKDFIDFEVSGWPFEIERKETDFNAVLRRGEQSSARRNAANGGTRLQSGIAQLRGLDFLNLHCSNRLRLIGRAMGSRFAIRRTHPASWQPRTVQRHA